MHLRCEQEGMKNKIKPDLLAPYSSVVIYDGRIKIVGQPTAK